MQKAALALVRARPPFARPTAKVPKITHCLCAPFAARVARRKVCLALKFSARSGWREKTHPLPRSRIGRMAVVIARKSLDKLAYLDGGPPPRLNRDDARD